MLPFHPYADLFPLIEGEAFDELVADIKANDVRKKIVVWDGAVLDGRNRYRAALAAGLIDDDDGPDRAKYFVRFVPSVDGDPLKFVISCNLRRRHLDDRQRASVAGKIANLCKGRPSEKPPIGGFSTDEAAATLNVAPRQVERARVVHAQGAPELRAALDRGDMPVSVAEQIARLPMVEQPQAVRRFLPNGHRAIAHSRVEDVDGLDYSPTPPWATRALIDHVMPKCSGIGPRTRIWEPACGEGHQAEVLNEYSREVVATDIVDYGYEGQLQTFDFLTGQCSPGDAEWIITNPPFNKAEQFALRAIELASTGVAFFTRWQWIEGVGRYERLFNVHPPAFVCPFAERVPLHMGRWEPEGGTLTAYCWIVWLPARTAATGRTELFWIPPGCRKALSRDDDAARFTTNPVTRKEHVLCDEPFDVSTGEISVALGTSSLDAPCCARDYPAPPIETPNLDAAKAQLDNLEIPAFLRRDANAQAEAG